MTELSLYNTTAIYPYAIGF